MNHNSLLASLSQLLRQHLGFRERDLIQAVQDVRNQANKAGMLNSSRTAIACALAYEKEAQQRAELLTNEMRKARISWSPQQLVSEEIALRASVSELFKDSLSQGAALVEQMAQVIQRPDGRRAFIDITDRASERAALMVDAVISEIVAAAKNDIEARSLAEKPSYVFQNTFQGHVASVAQGGASVGSVEQKNDSLTARDIAEVVASIIRVLPPEQHQAAGELKAAEDELRDGKLPIPRLGQISRAILKAGDLLLKAPDVAERVQKLLTMIGMN